MKIVQFKLEDEKVRIGILTGEQVIDVNESDSSIPHSLVDFLNDEGALEKLKS